jgi:alpha/beta superfamily hydrolase
VSFVGRTLIPAPHGQLEALYQPAPAAERAALVMHPHPLYGGTMHNKVVYRTAKALEAAGFATLRFNFRGVGDSTGSHDGGRGAAEDARGALDYLLAHQPAARQVVIAGFSFGAAVTLRFGCAEPRAHALIAIATPADWIDAGLLGGCSKPVRIHRRSGRDQRRSAASSAWSAATASHVIPGADHFFMVTSTRCRLPLADAVKRNDAAPPPRRVAVGGRGHVPFGAPSQSTK